MLERASHRQEGVLRGVLERGRPRLSFLGFLRAKTARESPASSQPDTGRTPGEAGRRSSSRGVKKPEMGGKCPHRKVKKRRFSHKTSRRSKFLLKGDDAVYDELMKLANSEGGEAKPLPLDEDLPGMGQFYCLHCDRYFASAEVRDDHYKSKLHKKRVKQMNGPAPHTQLDAELAAGMGRPDNGPKLMSM